MSVATPDVINRRSPGFMAAGNDIDSGSRHAPRRKFAVHNHQRRHRLDEPAPRGALPASGSADPRADGRRPRQ